MVIIKIFMHNYESVRFYERAEAALAPPSASSCLWTLSSCSKKANSSGCENSTHSRSSTPARGENGVGVAPVSNSNNAVGTCCFNNELSLTVTLMW